MAETEAARAVEKALAQSIRGLEDEDRLLVKLYYFDGAFEEAGPSSRARGDGEPPAHRLHGNNVGASRRS